ncbi:hypothetical protein [Flavihumibacter petaseus]|uniref:FHA domain-containing protein n=1 Tax=Flavihumibacter petaseus NBRC 106054 TaxID=1220578 RepID=A0A0E9MVA3_9BACT|nr:hypothetical protein [Flavihumibacter petaseus]GAO41060.1 hypothetical protein FPE01S_01_00720 [Flavihumibacter petaseus NBRC 106054]
MKKKSLDFFGALKTLILPATPATVTRELDNNAILGELLACFDKSCKKESVGSSLLFNMHFVIILHPDRYAERLASFPVIVKEAVKGFYKKLNLYKPQYEEISPVSVQWHFRFGEGEFFNGEKMHPDDIQVIGMLTGGREASTPAAGNTTKVTMKSKRTNVYEKMDINLDLLQQVNFVDTGSFSVRYSADLKLASGPAARNNRNLDQGIARISYYLADRNEDGIYLMKDKEMVIARKDPGNQAYSNYLLIDSGFVSDPHARIRLNESTGSFQIASFSRFETRVNEVVVPRSDPGQPQWVELANESQLLLNASVTLHFSAIT